MVDKALHECMNVAYSVKLFEKPVRLDSLKTTSNILYITPIRLQRVKKKILFLFNFRHLSRRLEKKSSRHAVRILRKLEFIRLSDHLVEQYKKTPKHYFVPVLKISTLNV